MAESKYAEATRVARGAASGRVSEPVREPAEVQETLPLDPVIEETEPEQDALPLQSAASDAAAEPAPEPASVAPASVAHASASAPVPVRDARRDELTHVDAKGEVRMVDVSDKAETRRIAIAEGTILMHPETQAMVLEDRAKKGDVLACARVAGIMAIKRTSDIIPMCHPLLITKSKCDIEPIAPAGTPADATPEGWAPARADGQVGFHVLVTAGVTGKTGIEMEALTGASAACLTIYDMCKAVDRGMEIVDVRLLRKEGGRSGVWDRAASLAAEAATAGAESEAASATAAPAPLPAAPAIAFIGYQNSGKTTLVEKVIAELTRRGLRVGSLKHHGHHGFDIDVPAKDSWRHHQAGSKHVGLICGTRWAEYADTREEDEMPARELLARYTDVDVVIVEGYKAEGFDNIVVARSGVDRLRGRSSLDLVDGHTLALACNEALVRQARDAGLEVPTVSINDYRAICDLIQDRMDKLARS